MMEAINLTLKAGDSDSLGNKVTRVLARDAGKKYAVWEVASGDVVADADDDSALKDTEITTLTIRVTGLIKSRKRFARKYITHIGHAYKLAFDGNPTGAIATLKTTYEEIDRRLLGEARLLYLVGALAVTLGCECCFWRAYLLLPEVDILRKLIIGLAMSVLGGFMSVAISLHKQKFELPESSLLLLIYGTLRLLLALLAGLVAVLMISTGVALSFLTEHNEVGGFLLACFLAGFSERLVATTLRQIESTAG